MKLNENQLKILSKTMFLKDVFQELPQMFKINSFNAQEIEKVNRDLRFVIFKKIENMMKRSQYYNDLYSISLPNETKLHEEKLKYTRWFINHYKDTLEYTDRLKFTFTILDPDYNYSEGIYDQYSELNFDSLLADGRKIIKCIAGNFKLLHQYNTKTMEKIEIYDAPNSDFIYRLCYYPNKKIWIELESKE